MTSVYVVARPPGYRGSFGAGDLKREIRAGRESPTCFLFYAFYSVYRRVQLTKVIILELIRPSY